MVWYVLIPGTRNPFWFSTQSLAKPKPIWDSKRVPCCDNKTVPNHIRACVYNLPEIAREEVYHVITLLHSHFEPNRGSLPYETVNTGTESCVNRERKIWNELFMWNFDGTSNRGFKKCNLDSQNSREAIGPNLIRLRSILRHKGKY